MPSGHHDCKKVARQIKTGYCKKQKTKKGTKTNIVATGAVKNPEDHPPFRRKYRGDPSHFFLPFPISRCPPLPPLKSTNDSTVKIRLIDLQKNFLSGSDNMVIGFAMISSKTMLYSTNSSAISPKKPLIMSFLGCSLSMFYTIWFRFQFRHLQCFN
jgi:hypothetical protein